MVVLPLGSIRLLPVIVASNLSNRQEEDLMKIFRNHQEAIGWTMTKIKGLSPTIVQHRINLNEEAKPTRKLQRRLNPIMQDAIKTFR